LAPDDDRLREHLQLAPATTDSEVVVELGRRTRTPPGQIILIVRNMDDLAREAAAAMGAIPGTVEKPSRQQRDRYCHDLAAAPGRSERDRFLDAMPSFRRLVEVLNRLLAAAGNS
jgi:putative SOS response-associated peptidase YedK